MYNYISDLPNIIRSEANTSEKAFKIQSLVYIVTHTHIYFGIGIKKKKFSIRILIINGSEAICVPRNTLKPRQSLNAVFMSNTNHNTIGTYSMHYIYRC